MPRLIAPLLLLGLLAPAAGAQTTPASDFTERGRSLDFILDALLPASEAAGEGGRTVALVIDPTASLVASGFPGAFRSALLRHREGLAGTRFAVFRVGGSRSPELPATEDPEAVEAAVRRIVASPTDAFQNVYAAVRDAAALLADLPGRREIVLVTLENGDAEDDLEGTVRAAAGAGAVVSVVGREAFLSDTWWFRRPRDDLGDWKLAGADSAFIELPWSYLLQWQVANERVASGFPMFGLSRLAQGTGGRVFLFYPPSAAVALCTDVGVACPLCRGDHLDCGEPYRLHRLRALAPLVGPREEVGKVVGKDPVFQAVQAAWVRAAKEGILMFGPSVEWAAGGLRIADLERGHLALLGDSLAFGVQAKRAEKYAKAADGCVAELERLLRLAGDSGLPRYRAMADTMRTELLLTAFNLREFAAFARDVGPEWKERTDPKDWPPPDVPPLRSDWLYSRLWFTNLSLCHGAAPYREVRLATMRDAARDFETLAAEVDGFLARQAGTPFAQVLRRQGLVRCWMSGVAKGGATAPRWVPSSPSSGAATEAAPRPARGAPAGGGTGTGPASGGR